MPGPRESSSEVADLRADVQDAERRLKSIEQENATLKRRLAAGQASKSNKKGRRTEEETAEQQSERQEKAAHRHIGALIVYLEDIFFSQVDRAFEVYLDPEYISNKNLVTTGGEDDVEVVQAEEDRWETWEEFEELRRSRDYGDKTAKNKAKEDKALQKEFDSSSEARARFDRIFLLMKKPWSSRLLLSSTQSVIATEANHARNFAAARVYDHRQVIFKGFDLEKEEVIDGLLNKDGFLYEDGECPVDPSERKNKLLKGPIVRAFQVLLYGPQAIGQKPPYAGGKTPHGTLIGLKEITPIFVAAMHVLSTKRDKVHVKGKGPLKRTPELTPARYAKLYHKRCAMFNTTLTTAVGAKRLQELNDAVIPAIRGDQELSEESDEAGQELEALFADDDDDADV
ncbi:hypothetical protein JCM5296_000567 [Sporobolomyces johnsonii]